MDEIQSEELRSALIDLEKIEQECQRRRKERGIDYFIPNAPQLRALRSPARVVAYVGGNRAGKSTTGAVFATSVLTGLYRSCACHGDWFNANKKFMRPTAGVIVVTEFAKVEQMLEKKLFSLMPKDWIVSIKRTPQGYMRRLICKNGSTVDILTNEMDQLAFESTDWDWAWIDEPTSYNRYVAIHRGLTDRQGLMILTFTPTVEPWMKDQIVDRADGRFIDVIQADTYENLKDIHDNPILTREAITDLERVMTEDEVATRIHGKFFHLRGLVYNEFTPSMHVQDFEYQYPDPVIAVMDPHDRLPHHVIWAYVDRNDWLYVHSELVINATTQDLKKAILAHEQGNRYKMVRRLIDPNFGRKPLITTGRTVIQELAMQPFSVRFGEANDDKTAGHMKVREYLHWDRKRPVDLQNTPRIFFHRGRTPKTIHSMQNYQFDEWVGKSVERKDPKEKERPKDTHGADCVRYLCMGNPRFDMLANVEHQEELEEAPY